jgi:hypothetical protein
MNVRKMIIVALGIVLLTGLLASSASAESRKHLIIVDLRHNGPAGFIGSKKAALSYLESQFRAGDEVSLLALSSIGGIQVIEDLTADTDLLRKKIADFHGIPEQLNGLFGGVLFGRLREYGLMEDLGCPRVFPFPFTKTTDFFTIGSMIWPRRSPRPARPSSPSMSQADGRSMESWIGTITSSGNWPIFPAGDSAGPSMN